jgi:hypothetical protein
MFSSIQVAFLAGREQLCLDKRVQKEQNSNAKVGFFILFH